MTDEIPIPVADDERIVRAIMVPAHLDQKGRLKRAAFRPAPETDAVSAMRAEYMTETDCKVHAKKAANPNAKYVGFAKISAREIRECGSEVVDAREDFFGHAHICHGIASPPRGEPLPPQILKQLEERLDCLRNKSRFIPDSNIESDTWDQEAF
jgi:hypothetical protein